MNYPSVEKAGHVAEKYIALYAEKTISDDDGFPFEIWKELGRAGVLGLAVPAEYGGAGAGSVEISRSFHELALKGGNLGICLSVLIHNMVAGFVIAQHGTDGQKKRILPMMADGRITGSFAVSEPGRGGHPKLIQTRAERTIDGSFSITGEKTYLTNGPISDFFVVIAVSGEDEGKKKFTAFIVDASEHGNDRSGVEKTPQMKIPFFRPSPHGGVILNGYKASEEDIIGLPDRAYETIVLPFRDIENCFMAGAVSGALKRITIEAVKTVKAFMSESHSVSGVSKDVMILLGRMEAISDLAADMALRMAEAFDKKLANNIQQKYFFQFREICQIFNSLLESWKAAMAAESSDRDIKSSRIFMTLSDDIVKSAGLGEYILKANLAKSGIDMIRQEA